HGIVERDAERLKTAGIFTSRRSYLVVLTNVARKYCAQQQNTLQPSQTGQLMMSLPNLKGTLSKVNRNEILDVLGPLVQFLTLVSDSDEDYWLMRGTVPAVPLHGHAEQETFYVLEGEVQGLWGDHWITLGAGDVFDVPGGLKYSWRNVSGASVSLLFIV